MKKFWIVFGILVVIVVGGMVVVWRGLTSLETHGEVRGGVLVWRADGAISEAAPTSFLSRLREGNRPTLSAAVLALHRAARDPRITALVIDLRGLDVGWAAMQELRDAVLVVKASGKPVWACIGGADSRDFALATAADRIALEPEGDLAILGVAAELAFLKDTLAKVGIEAQFVHVGKYKSAPEQYTRSEPTPENREMVESIVEDRYQALIAMISEGRRADPAAVRGWIDTGLFDAPTALATGLVDTLAGVDDIVDGVYADEDVTEFADYLAAVPRAPHAAPAIGLIVASGTIMPGKSRDDSWQGPVLGSETIVDQLRDADDDDDVRAVVLRVDSPGGSVLASDQIWQEVAHLQQHKPVIVSMGDYAASGGYYLSCAAESLFADPQTLTGSIGVFAGKLNWSGLYDKIDLNRQYVTRGENALLYSDATGFTPRQEAQLQAQLDRFYERFLAKVASGRRLAHDDVAAVAQGRVWTGNQARTNGLVDGLGGLSRALRAAKLRLGLDPAAPVRVLTYERPLSWLQRWLLENFDAASATATPGLDLPASAVGLLRQSGFLGALPLLDGQPLALLPYRVLDE